MPENHGDKPEKQTNVNETNNSSANIWSFLHENMSAKQRHRLTTFFFFALNILILVGILSLIKTAWLGGEINLFGQSIKFDYYDYEEKEEIKKGTTGTLAEGVIDIDEIRIQWGTFITSKGWNKIQFRENFRDSNVSVSVSGSESPDNYYPFLTRNISKSGFEVLYGKEEADPIFTKYWEKKNGRQFNRDDAKTFGVDNFNEKYKQLEWIFKLGGLKGNFIAIGRKP